MPNAIAEIYFNGLEKNPLHSVPICISIMSIDSRILSIIHKKKVREMKTYMAVIERDQETGLYVGYVPGLPGAHSQGETLDELNRNLHEVLEMLLEDGTPELDAEFVGTQAVMVG